MELQRKVRRAVTNMSNPPQGKSSQPESSQSVATLVVMIIVLTIIIMFCCFAAPGIRDLCKKYVFRTCVMDDPEQDNASATGESTTPTIILLPYGRMLVVDRSVFAQLQADHTGIDFMELSADLIRAQRRRAASTPSLLDSETTSKGLSPAAPSPPAYEDIFGDLPPSYSEVGLAARGPGDENDMNGEPEGREECGSRAGRCSGGDCAARESRI